MTLTASSDGTSTATSAAVGPADFGKFILDGIPYKYDEKTEPVLETGKGILAGQLDVLKDGPAQAFGENPGEDEDRLPLGTAADIDAKSPPSEAQIRANPSQSIWWYFAGQPHRVTKAMRFAYTVNQGGVPVTKHILIGYEGVDPQG